MLDIIPAIQSEAAPCGAASPFCSMLVSQLGVALLIGCGLLCLIIAARLVESIGSAESFSPQDAPSR